MAQVCMVALDDMTKENGCPELAPQRWKMKEGWLFESDSSGPVYPPEDELGPWVPVELKMGDVLVYDLQVILLKTFPDLLALEEPMWQ